MDYKEVEILLEKYFEGHSSLSEEEQLSAYFRSVENIPEEFEYAREMFGHFKAEAEETFGAPVMRLERNKRHRRLWNYSGIAASLALALSAVLWLSTPEKTAYAFIDGKAITEKDVALDELKKALSIMTKNLNQGTEGLSQLSKLDQIKKSISKRTQ